MKTLSLKLWYKVLLENFILTETDANGFQFDRLCKIEREHPGVDWDRTWGLASTPGLESCDHTFLWRMVHNILPTQDRLHRLLRNVDSPACTLCLSQDTCNLSHAFFTCSHNSEVGQWLLQIICRHLPRTVPQQVVLLDLNLDEHLRLPIIWLVAKTLSNIFSCRMDKKACTLFNTRTSLEASIMLLRKTRHRKAAETLQNLVSQS